MIDETAVANALGKKLTTTTLGYPIVWENAQVGLPAAPYLVFEIVRTGTTDATYNGSAQISRGFVQITVVSALGAYANAALTIAGKVATRFKYPTVLTEPGVEVTIVAPPAIGQGYPDGVHWRTPVKISYSALERAIVTP